MAYVTNFADLPRQAKLEILPQMLLARRSMQTVVNARSYVDGLYEAQVLAEGREWDLAAIRLQLQGLSNEVLNGLAEQTAHELRQVDSELASLMYGGGLG